MAKAVTWCYHHYLNESVHCGEQRDCELRVEKMLTMILSVEKKDEEEVEDV